MSASPSSSSQSGASSQSFLDKHHFLLRRLHSLTGIVPIGLFLIAHLTTNSSIVWGKFGLRAEGTGYSLVDGGVAYFWKEVKWINEQIPHLLLIEIVLWLSIAFHSIFGIIYARSGRSNTGSYAFGGNFRYWLQRMSGYIGVLYIFYHVATLRWGWTFLVPGGTKWSHQQSVSTMVAALQGSTTGWTVWGVVVSIFYFVGVTALVFHFANGLWTAAITWGLTVSRTAQQRWGYACAALGVGLMGMAWASLIGFKTLSFDQAAAVEKKLLSTPAASAPVEAPGKLAETVPSQNTP